MIVVVEVLLRRQVANDRQGIGSQSNFFIRFAYCSLCGCFVNLAPPTGKRHFVTMVFQVRCSSRENDLYAFLTIEEAEQDGGLADFGTFNMLIVRQLVVDLR